MICRAPLQFVAAGLLVLPVSSLLSQTSTPDRVPDRTKADTQSVPTIKVEGIAAHVGDKVILMSEVAAEVLRARAGSRVPLDSAAGAKLAHDVLEGLIDAEVLVQRALADKIEVKDADLEKDADAQAKEIRGRFQSDAEFLAALKEQGFGTIDEWKKLNLEQLRRNYLQRELFQKQKKDGKLTNVNVTEAEVSEAFQANKAQMPHKEARVGFRQIVIATAPSETAKKRARARADSLYTELVAHPETFEATAKRESMDPSSKELGGDLGWNRRGKMVPEFDRVMFSLNPGVISPVVESPFGYHIIRVDRVQPSEVKARHILIMPARDSMDAKRTKLVADSVALVWRSGAKYDTLVAHFHDNANEEKSIPEFLRDSLPESYVTALKDHKVGDIVGPFPIQDPSSGQPKFVLLQITMSDEAGEYTLPELREKIRAQLSEERSTRRYIDQLRKQTYIAVKFGNEAQATKPK